MKGLRAGKPPRIPLAAAVTAGALLASLTGCVTVHGESAVVPALSEAEAAKVLTTFVAKNNRANTAYDAGLNARIETGALGAIDQAGLKSRKEVRPKGNPDYQPLKLTDTRYLIPEQAGWPKFFVTDSRSNRKGQGRWLFVFQRQRADGPWKASYLSVVAPDQIPRFARDEHGRVKAVPVGGGSGLTVPPDELSKRYTRYLQEGAGDDFAAGRHTTALREKREKALERENVRNEFADRAAQPPQYAPFGLRTKDGGALVFFTTLHHHKQTLPRGYKPQIKDPLVKAMMSGTPKQSVTFVRVSEQAVTVPGKRAQGKSGGDSGGKVVFLSRIEGLTAARGE
ncbi:hypothetical protein [Streptomyces qinglanensis]|uniref:DUF8094 domain-containing protein n=1 Tax=Streptomyces qinglanensis TaxID=943816 RepID=A0A1H9NQY7_9ACTN|nr:hypothetical protein [Streptomyces qinglanensis]SER38366.1 hypothetical protein SAMN05421870_101594 [Streptomyces qinglanensis]